MSKGPDQSTPSLHTPVQFLKGVGPQRAELMEKLELFTVADCLFYFPRDYQDLTDLARVADLTEDLLVRISGTVVEIEQRGGYGGRSKLGVLLQCGEGAEADYVRALWFNMPHMRGRFDYGQRVLLSGKAKKKATRWEFSHPNVQKLENDEETPSDQKILPVYGLTEGLGQIPIRRAVRASLDKYVQLLDEVFPPDFLAAHDLMPVHEALEQIHFPRDRQSLERARRRFVYQELFILQLALAVRRLRLQVDGSAPQLEATAKIDARIRRLLPFSLTEGQEQAVREIAADMARHYPMNRLLQGEVGSGKTIVAMYAVLTAVAHGRQAAIMAPTEVLARQHARTLGKLLSDSRVRWTTLTGSLSQAERRDVLAGIKSGAIDVVIGTQAILHEGVEFAKLGLVVVDEQHKFGVRQRAKLRRAGQAPHSLVMTATPIPRTVTMTLFGDLDVSTIRDTPPGRMPVKTYFAPEEQRERWWEFVRKKLREGRQAYVIVPYVDSEAPAGDDAEGTSGTESTTTERASVMRVYESLADGPLAAFRIGILHGRLSNEEKEAAMNEFASGKTQVLVATTVVEVGIDVPNAVIMTIEGGERFGLSQLHQLRGRIVRGNHAGFCTVFAKPATDDGLKRLEAFVASNDGFALAETDFALRGPGDLLGTKQHGLPPLRIADLVRDAALVEQARADALALVTQDPGLAKPEHERLRKQMLKRYAQVLELGDVG
ncbi:MAG: ATP-dependent DNA helicase RecG [Planctomycetia bacterium]|nr:ATP-dependent DNA helicase RecG [Planctomycetia bacterium]